MSQLLAETVALTWYVDFSSMLSMQGLSLALTYLEKFQIKYLKDDVIWV